jgi:hypothetical protein
MDRLARTVAARWGLKVATAGARHSVPAEAIAWANRFAFIGELDDYSVTPVHHTDAELFQDARDSVEALLPNFLGLLYSKLHEHYHAAVSKSGTRIYYFFQAHDPIDAFAVNIIMHQGELYLVVGYVPYNVAKDRMDYSKAIQYHTIVGNPDLAGMTMMRLARSLLARVA